ncbi:MAG: SAM-dependent methyltransferase [Candidatus Kapaibacterium sp.]
MSKEELKKGILYIVSTPIGNRNDISLRAIQKLKLSDKVLCENKKQGAIILRNANLSKPLDELNEKNEKFKTQEVIADLLQGRNISLISDSGTPVFEDPGLALVRACINQNIDMEVIPGASSIMTALVRSGFDLSSFVYGGFLSREPSERLQQLRELAKEKRTVALLETPYRLYAILSAAAKIMPDRNAYMGVNLTMPFETHHYGTFDELREKFEGQNLKAEFVICFEGLKSPDKTGSDKEKYKFPSKRFKI